MPASRPATRRAYAIVLFVSASLVAVLAGCEDRGFAAARARDTEDAYRSFLTRHGDGAHGREARARLESLRFRAAEQARSVYGYRRYLADYPEGRFAPAARDALERLRFERARAAGDAAALRRFLAMGTDAKLLAEARALLARVEAAAALARGSAAALRAFVDEFPEAPAAAAARARLRELELAAAGDDFRGLERIVERYPGSAEAQRAADRREWLVAEQVLLAGAEAPAALERFRVRFPHSARTASLADEVARRGLARATARLDAAALEEWLRRHPGHAEARAARRLLRALRGRAGLAARARELLDRALPYRPAAPLEDLRSRALEGDLETARRAVAELGFLETPDAAALLVDLATGAQLAIAEQAEEALGRLCRRRGTATCRVLLAGAHTARPGEPRGLREALIRIATGDEEGAARALEAEMSGAPAGGTRVLPAVLHARLRLRRGSLEVAQVALDQALASIEAHAAALERLFPVELDRDHLPEAVLAARTLAALGRLCASLGADERAAAPGARMAARLSEWEQQLAKAMPGFARAAGDPLNGRPEAHERGRAAALAALEALARREPLVRATLEAARAGGPEVLGRNPVGPSSRQTP